MSTNESIAHDPTMVPDASSVGAHASSSPPSSRSRVDPNALLHTRVADRYEVLEVLGAGGMGTVYRAVDRELDEPVALKVLRPEIAEMTGMAERFRREVKLARRVTHPNVARVYEIGEHQGLRFLTMEYVAGTSLARAVHEQGGRLPLPRAVAIVVDVCGALAAAHAAGVIHRDIKPDNVLLAADGRVVVTDFGIARSQFEAQSAARTTTPTGTPAYMAPEQLLNGEITPRADLYALGVMMFELFTGQLPWRGESVYAVAIARLRDAPPDPLAIEPTLPPPLGAAVLRCLARDPAGRYASANEVAAALGAAGVAREPGGETGPVRRQPTALIPFDTDALLRAVDEGAPSIPPPAARATGETTGRHGTAVLAEDLGAGDSVPPRETDTRPARPSQRPEAQDTNVRAAGARRGERASSPAVDEVISAATPSSLPSLAAAVTTGTGARPRYLAVLPIRNGAGPDDAPAVDGLTEDLIDALSTTRGLRVLARGAVARYRNTTAELDARRVGAELSVDMVVDGSVRRVGRALRLSTRLIDVRDGCQAWARRTDVLPEQLLDVPDEIARAIAEALALETGSNTLPPEPASAAATATTSGVVSSTPPPATPSAPPPAAAPPASAARSDRVAQDLYVRARHHLNQFMSRALRKSANLFEQALVRAPEDPRLHAGLALALARRAMLDGDLTQAELAAMRAAAAMAVAHGAGRAESHLALAHGALCGGEPATAARALRQTVALAPSNAEAQELLGRMLLEAGYVREGLRRLDVAVALGPRRALARWPMVRAALAEGDWARGEALLNALLSPRHARAVTWVYRVREAGLRGDREKLHALEQDAARAAGREPVDLELLTTMFALFAHGRSKEACALAEKRAAAAGADGRRRVFYLQLATEFAAFAGRTDAALDALGRAAAAGLLDLRWLEGCTALEPLRGTPEYAQAVTTVRERGDALFDAVYGVNAR